MGLYTSLLLKIGSLTFLFVVVLRCTLIFFCLVTGRPGDSNQNTHIKNGYSNPRVISVFGGLRRRLRENLYVHDHSLTIQRVTKETKT